MRIALLHGWSLSGSGSNEYTRYLARSLVASGHQVHILCRQPNPEKIEIADRIFAWDSDGQARQLHERSAEGDGTCTLHQLPHGDVRPVYVTDKQRPGPVKPFTVMTDDEVEAYQRLYTRTVAAVLAAHPVDVLHANHVVMQPTVAAAACAPLGIPFVIYPHGSAIEYTVRPDPRFQLMAREAIERAAGLIIGSHEVKQRLCRLFPELEQHIEARTEIVGVGVDTSLFEPVAREARPQSIERLVALQPQGGKTPALLQELHTSLEHGDLEAVGRYQHAYARTLPDQNCAAQLQRIPWQQGKILLFVGALTAGKGLHRVIAAMPRLLSRVPDAHLVIVGSGAHREVLESLVHALSRSDDSLLQALVARGHDLLEGHLQGPWSSVSSFLSQDENRALLREHGQRLAEHVHFLGRLDHALLRHLFPCADVAVFPSIVPEAYPLVLMESLANGVLPAVSDFSGFAEGLDALIDELGEETVASMRLPLESDAVVGSIADRLATLLSMGESEALRSRLRAIAVERYDWHVRAQQMVRAYGVMLER